VDVAGSSRLGWLAVRSPGRIASPAGWSGEDTKGLEAHLVDDKFGSGTLSESKRAMIIEFCDGKHSVAEIVTMLAESYSLADAPVEEVHAGAKPIHKSQ